MKYFNSRTAYKNLRIGKREFSIDFLVRGGKFQAEVYEFVNGGWFITQNFDYEDIAKILAEKIIENQFFGD